MSGRRSARHAVHFCTFTSLHDLKVKDEREDEVVLEALRAVKQVSIFDITRSQALARTVSRLQDRGRVRLIRDGYTYPWLGVEVPA